MKKKLDKLAEHIQLTIRFHIEQTLLLAIYARVHFRESERNRSIFRLIKEMKKITHIDNKKIKDDELLSTNEFSFIIHQLNKGKSVTNLLELLKNEYGSKKWLEKLTGRIDNENIYWGLDSKHNDLKYCLFLQDAAKSTKVYKVINNLINQHELITINSVSERYETLLNNRAKNKAFSQDESRVIQELKESYMKDVYNAIWTNGFDFESELSFYDLYVDNFNLKLPEEYDIYKKTEITNKLDNLEFEILRFNPNLLRNIKEFHYELSMGDWLARTMIPLTNTEQIMNYFELTSRLYKECKSSLFTKVNQIPKVVAKLIEHDVEEESKEKLDPTSERVEKIIETSKGLLQQLPKEQIKKGYKRLYIMERTTNMINKIFDECNLMDDWKKQESMEYRFKGKLKALHTSDIDSIIKEQSGKIQRSSLIIPLWSRVNNLGLKPLNPLSLYIL